VVASLDGVRFRYVFALFGFSIPARAGLVINAPVRVHLNHASTAGWRTLLCVVVFEAGAPPGAAADVEGLLEMVFFKAIHELFVVFILKYPPPETAGAFFPTLDSSASTSD